MGTFHRNLVEISVSLSVQHLLCAAQSESQVSELALETFISCDREKRRIKTTWAGLQKAWEEAVVLNDLHAENLLMQRLALSSLLSSLWAFYKETFIYSKAFYSQCFVRSGFLCRLLHVAEVFLWNCLLETQFNFCFLDRLFFFARTPWRLKGKMK